MPKYRFPEFLQSKEWRVENLGSVTYAVSRKNTKGDKYTVYSINNKEGFLPQEEQFEGVDSNSRGYDISLYKIVDKNTFAYNPARINVGSIGYSGELHDIIISSLYVCFKTNEKIDDRYFQHFLSTSIFSQQVENKAEGGIRSYLFYENFSKILSAFPDIREQQKIADCLSSLDDLIASENKKLETFKAHKKGLMQKLFPAEGKTIPEIRLKGFTNAWKRYKLGEVAEIIDGDRGKNYPNGNDFQEQGHTLFLSAANITKDGFSFELNQYITEEKSKSLGNGKLQVDDVVLTSRGSLGRVAWYNSKIHQQIPYARINSGMLLLRANENTAPNYIEQFLKSPIGKNQIDSISFGSAQPQLTKKDISSYSFYFPTYAEQIAIGNIFCNLDEFITAQAEKIEALKLHKKGLMQGLFPSVQEVIE